MRQRSGNKFCGPWSNPGKGRRNLRSCGALRNTANNSSGTHEKTQHYAGVLLAEAVVPEVTCCDADLKRGSDGRELQFEHTGRDRFDWPREIHPTHRAPVSENAAKRGGVSGRQGNRAMESFAL